MKFTINGIILLILVISFYFYVQEVSAERRDPMDQYNVVWDTPSKDSFGSMPIGNGDIGVNLWVKEDGDLFFYISKTDAWSENGRLLKLGRVRVKFLPNPFLKGMPFLQTLKLRQGEIEIHAGKGNSEMTLKVWVDANQPVIRVEATGKQNFDIQVFLEVWRNKKRLLSDGELHSAYGLQDAPHPVFVYPDTVRGEDNRIVWFHRNSTSIYPETMKLQGLENLMQKFSDDPLLNRTFGGIIKGDGLVSDNATRLRSAESKKHYIILIYPFTKQTASIEEWIQELEQQITQIESKDLEEHRANHQKWWDDFWHRSWIRVSGSGDAEVVTRGYILQRFISACSGRGVYPIKFNGSIFTVDALEKGKKYDADYRRWGGPYWFQNTRLVYWPMLASGDFDMMQPFFRMFYEALPLAKKRTELYFGHKGAFFPETMYFWGTYANSDYGWNREGKDISYVDNTYIRHYWQGGVELAAMMLDYYAYTQDKEFLKNTLLPLVDAIIQFYDEHYSRDKKGKILFKPAQALETWQEVVNPLPVIAGLQFILNRLLELPSGFITNKQRTDWKRLREEIPELPIQKKWWKTILLPAQEVIGPIKNSENPELYAIFPYRLFGIGKPDLETGLWTFERRRFKGTGGWRQDAIQSAYLGLTEIARSYIVNNFSTYDRGSRFPAFWGPNFDWIPDQDHGDVAIMALQAMLMQADGNKIYLFPAWPKDWDVEFKLHAPRNTTVEGIYHAGKVERLTVTPKERMNDVVKMDMH